MDKQLTTPAGGQVEGLDQALAAVREKALAEGRAAGYAQGRTDAAAILMHAEARGREELAAEYAADAAMTPDRAITYLTKSPKPQAAATPFAKLMEGKSPTVGNGEPPRDDEAVKAARVAQLQAIGKKARG